MIERRPESADSRPLVTVIGLGPAEPDLCTAATLDAIERHRWRYVRTARHPAVSILGESTALDHHYESAGSFEQTYAGLVEEVVAGAERHGRVLYAVPGSPMVAERTVELLLADDRVDVSLVPALSFLDLAWVRIGVDPLAGGVRIIDARHFSVEAAGERGPLLVAQVDTLAVLEDVVAAVHDPPEEPVVVLQGLGTGAEWIGEVMWEELSSTIRPDHLTSLWIPRFAAPVAAELQSFSELVTELRLRCPWDAEQTHASLRPHLLEEAHEVLEALDAFNERTGDGSEALKEELGDLLFQVVFHSRIAADDGRFDLADVARGINDKLRHRHPHVFPQTPDGEILSIESPDEVLLNWDVIKKAEKGRASVLDGIPATLPALAVAEKVVRRAAGLTGAPLPPPAAVAIPDAEQSFGDLLLGLVAAARTRGIGAEEALRGAVARYSKLIRTHELGTGAPG